MDTRGKKSFNNDPVVRYSSMTHPSFLSPHDIQP
jgi:hypothetical protein